MSHTKDQGPEWLQISQQQHWKLYSTQLSFKFIGKRKTFHICNFSKKNVPLIYPFSGCALPKQGNKTRESKTWNLENKRT